MFSLIMSRLWGEKQENFRDGQKKNLHLVIRVLVQHPKRLDNTIQCNTIQYSTIEYNIISII